MITISIRTAPKGYFPFYSRDVTLHPKKPREVLTTQVRRSSFGENVVDSFYNETFELGEMFSIKTPAPILRWHSAKRGTTSKFQGCLNKIFPELEKISDKGLDKLIKDIRDRER